MKGKRIFIAPGADIIGAVILHEDVSVWFNVTIRGDLEPVTIGYGSNVQDGSTIHTDQDLPTVVGENVTIGHNCILHGCIVGDGSLVGMGSTILSGARIGKNCLIAGGSLVTGRMNIPDGMLVFGSPAKIIKPLKDGVIARNLENSLRYIALKDRYLGEGTGVPGK